MTGLLFALLVVPALAWVFLFRHLIRGADPRSPLRRRPRKIDVRIGVDAAQFMRALSRAMRAMGVSMEQAAESLARSLPHLERAHADLERAMRRRRR